MAEKVSIQQQIQQYRQSNPELKNFSDEQILSIMVQNSQITLTKAQQQCIFSNNTTEPNLTGLSFEHISTPQNVNVPEIKVKSKDGKTYNFNKTLQNRINNVSVNLKKAENENGFIGSAWSGFKNLTGIGDSSDKVREQLESEKNLLTQFNSNEQRRPQIFKELTGFDYTSENLEKFIKGEIKLKSEQALNDYKEGQEMAVDVIADVAAGVASYAVASACIAGGIAAAPFTAGASLTGVAIGFGIAAGTGTVVKTGLKYADAKSGGREYTLDNAIYDSSTGAVSGALGIFTAGAGGAIGNGTKTLAVNALDKTALKEGAKQTIANATGFTATVVADGAIGGGVDNGFRTAIQGGSVGDVADATITGAGYGAVLGPVMGWGGKGVAKAGKEVVHWLPFGEVPKDVPQVVIPKKTTTDLYPTSDADELVKLKTKLSSQASGTETIELNELTANPYKKEVAVKKTKDEYCFDVEGENVAIGEEYTVIKTLNDGSYKIFKSTQSGSNPGFWVEHVGSGDLYYFKTGNGQQNVTEHVVSQLYKAAGIDTPDMNLVAGPGFNDQIGIENCWIKSKAIAGLKPIYEDTKLAHEGFAVDAWLANWDAVCSGNTCIKNGSAVRLDFGGALNFRARGAKKNFGNQVTELSTLLDPNINPESASVLKNMTREDLIKSLERVQSVTNDDIQNLYNSVKIYMNPELFSTIQNRKTYMSYVLNEVRKMEIKPNETIFDYVKRVENAVNTKYSSKINAMNTESEKRVRVINDMIEQRNTVCTNEDNLAIWDYKGSSYTANTCIQQGRLDDPLVTKLDVALDKTALSEDIVLHRGDHFIIDSHTNLRYADLFPEYDECSFGHMKFTENSGFYDPNAPLTASKWVDGKLIINNVVSMDEIVGRIFKKGKIVKEEQFVSTTVSPQVAKEFGKGETDIIYRFKAPKGTKATCPEKLDPANYGDKKSGAVGNLTGRLEGSEAEILLKRGFSYRMDNLIKENGQYIIECTILQ